MSEITETTRTREHGCLREPGAKASAPQCEGAQPGVLFNILLVEDDIVDVMAFRRAVQQEKVANQLFVAKDGIDALHILRGDSELPKIPHPYVIMLDLNMPRMNGIEFLKELRCDPKLSSSIVFVLTTSENEQDTTAAFDCHVAGYFLKYKTRTEVTGIIEMLQRTATQWQRSIYTIDPLP